MLFELAHREQSPCPTCGEPRSRRRLSQPHPVPFHRRRSRRARAVGDRWPAKVVRLTGPGTRRSPKPTRLQADAIDAFAPLDEGSARAGLRNGPDPPSARWRSTRCRRPRAAGSPAGRPRLGGRAARRAICGRTTAGTRRSRRSSRDRRRLRRASATPGARRRGSPSSTANASAACSAPPPTTPTPPSCVCCSSNRPRAAPVSAPGWWTSACASRDVPVIANHVVDHRSSDAGPRALPAGRVSPSTVVSREQSFGHDIVGEYWSRDL